MTSIIEFLPFSLMASIKYESSCLGLFMFKSSLGLKLMLTFA